MSALVAIKTAIQRKMSTEDMLQSPTMTTTKTFSTPLKKSKSSNTKKYCSSSSSSSKKKTSSPLPPAIQPRRGSAATTTNSSPGHIVVSPSSSSTLTRSRTVVMKRRKKAKKSSSPLTLVSRLTSGSSNSIKQDHLGKKSTLQEQKQHQEQQFQSSKIMEPVLAIVTNNPAAFPVGQMNESATGNAENDGRRSSHSSIYTVRSGRRLSPEVIVDKWSFMTGLKVVVPPSSPTPPTTTTTTTIHSKNAKTNHLDQLTRLNIETDTATSTSCSSATTSSPRPALRGKVLLSPSPMTTDRGFFDSSSTHFAFHSSITTTARSSALRHHLMYQELNGEARGDALPEINTNSYMDSSYRSLSTSSPSASCLSSSPSSLVTPDGQLLKLVRNPNGNELYYTLASPTTGYDDNDNEENEYIGPLTGETMDRFYPVEDISRHNENADSEDSAVHILDSPIEYNGPGMFTDGLFSVLLPLPPPAQPHQQPPPAAAVISTTTAFATSAIYHRPSISHSISDLKDGSDNTPIERRKTPMPPSRTRKGIYKPSEMEAKRLADLMIATTTAATSSSVSPVSGSSHSAASSVLLDSDEVLRLIMEKETPFYQRKNSFSGLLAGYSFAATPDADAAAPSVEENEEEEKDDDDDDIPLAHLSISTSRKSSIAPASCIPSPSASLSSPLSPSSHNISKQRKCSCLSNQSRATGCPSIKQQEDQMDTETLSDRDNHLLFESYFGDNNKACSSSSSGYIGHTRNFSLGAVRPRRKSTPFSSPSFMPISSSTTTTISSSPPALVHPMAETCWSPDVLADLEMIAAEQVLELKPFDILMQPQSQKLMMIENDDKHPQKSKLRLMSIFRKI